VHSIFPSESTGERISKIGPHLPKLSSNIELLTFYGTQCSSIAGDVRLLQNYEDSTNSVVYTGYCRRSRERSNTRFVEQLYTVSTFTLFQILKYCHSYFLNEVKSDKLYINFKLSSASGIYKDRYHFIFYLYLYID